jgi:uncharacterized coiled-coil protein SlyX
MDDSCQYITRDECNAHRQLLEQRIAFADRRADNHDAAISEINNTLNEMRKDINVQMSSLETKFNSILDKNDKNHELIVNKFDTFYDRFNNKLIYILLLVIVILVVICLGKSVDFGWLIT